MSRGTPRRREHLSCGSIAVLLAVRQNGAVLLHLRPRQSRYSMPFRIPDQCDHVRLPDDFDPVSRKLRIRRHDPKSLRACLSNQHAVERIRVIAQAGNIV